MEHNVEKFILDATAGFRMMWFNKHHISRDYGSGLQPETWQGDLKRAFKEFWRLLKPFGVLIFKWGDDRIKVKHLFPLFPEKPLFGQTTTGGKYAKTYWFCFMKIPTRKNEN